MDPALDGPLPVLLIGDLNAPPDEPELAPLREVTIDTWEAGGGDPAATTLDSLLPYAPLEATTLIDRRIDHVLVRPGRPGATVTVRGAFIAGDRPIDGHYPSDHYAIGADLDP
jgi:endonuclease/exonuclease/phosphatase family metal-dependent hydrolase